MRSNLNSWDRAARVLIAVLFTILYFTNVISGALGIILLVVGGIFLLTSVINFCPIYYVLGITTNKRRVAL